MKISIDPGRCTGHARCVAVAPSLFVDDERGYGQVRREDGLVRDEEVEAGRRAVSSCPERAITLE